MAVLWLSFTVFFLCLLSAISLLLAIHEVLQTDIAFCIGLECELVVFFLDCRSFLYSLYDCSTGGL